MNDPEDPERKINKFQEQNKVIKIKIKFNKLIVWGRQEAKIHLKDNLRINSIK